MKKLLSFLLCTFFAGVVSAGFNFSDNSSKIQVGSNASLVVNKEIDAMTGTLDLANNDPERMTGSSSVVFHGGNLGVMSETIQLNAKEMSIAASGGIWDGTVYFEDANNTMFHGREALSGSWIFSGQKNIVNGNGCVLDMTNGGRIVVKPGSILQLNDVEIKGIGNVAGLGSFVLESETSKIIFSRVTVELDSGYTTNMGNIYVDGSSTVIVKDHQWLFDGQGSLSVDGVTLWTDRAAELSLGIGIAFGAPESAHFSSISSGTIKSMAAGTDDIMAVIEELRDEQFHLHPGAALRFDTNQTLDSGGKPYIFSRSGEPQFIVAPGVTVTLQNTELLRINSNTFDIGAGATIKVGSNVVFELSDDIIWNDCTLELVGDDTVFTVRGISGQRKFVIADVCDSNNLVLQMGSGTVLLENVALSGLDLCDGTRRLRDRYFSTGTIALGGSASVDITNSTPMNFEVRGNRNELRMIKNDLTFSGDLSFGDRPDNELHIKFLLEDTQEVPRLSFGNSFAMLTSAAGWARLVFDDPVVQVWNATENSFVVSDRSYLGGYYLEILNEPIKQVSQNFIMAPGLMLGSSLPNAIDQQFFRSPFKTELDVQEPLCELLRAWGVTGADLEVRYATVKLSQAKSNIWVEDGAITGFGISESQPLNLTMAGNTVVTQANAATSLKVVDTLSVQGVDNKLVVKNRLTMDGALSFAEGSQLTIEFSDEGTSPEVVFSSDLLTIARGAKLLFTGIGRVTFADGYTIQFDGTVSGKTSTLALQGAAQLALQENATVTIAGTGKLLVDDKSQLHIQSGRHLVVGQSASDSIDICIDRQGEISVEAARNETPATLSLHTGAYSLDISRQGKLHLGSNGTLEVNLLSGQPQPGYLSRFALQTGGILQVGAGGTMILAANNNDGSGDERPFTWDNLDGVTMTGGLVGFVGSSFAGLIQAIPTGTASLLPKAFTLNCINTMPELLVTTVFFDEFGNQKLITKDGVIVTLSPTDQVLRDDAQTGAVAVISNGALFGITAAGRRV